MAVLRELGLHDLVRGKGFDTPAMVAEMDGRRLVELSFGAPLPDGTRNQTITRADLYGVLRDEAVRHGTCPLLDTGGYARGVEPAGEPGVMHMFFGRRWFFSYVKRRDGEVWWFANPPQPHELPASELAKVTPAQWRARLHEMFADDDIPATAVIDATGQIFAGWNTYDFPKVPVWHRDRMIIIGDAAHATSPASGQGASMALEDAVTLAKCLRDLPDVPAAFAAYEDLRRTPVERVVAQGKRNGDGKDAGPVMRLFLPVIFKFVAKAANKQGSLYDHRIDWDEPVTASLPGSPRSG
ncbi:MAG TPA: FAD-dependent monooxygenase [Actinophytocola sp.]|nr:FAD-dependent monooxygenase [Actinophytocola sp.]